LDKVARDRHDDLLRRAAEAEAKAAAALLAHHEFMWLDVARWWRHMAERVEQTRR